MANKKISDFPARAAITDTDNFLSEANDITYKTSAQLLYDKNAYVRDDVNLGSTFTAAQAAAIANGTFKGLYLGAYWLISNVKYRIWAFDWYYGKMSCTTHHCVVVPDELLASDKNMESTATTANGYGGSRMRTTHLPSVKSTIQSAFGSAYILPVYQYLSNSGSAAGAAGFAEYSNCTVELLSETMLYGCNAHGKGEWNINNNFPILPLALLRPKYVAYNRQSFWLRDVVNASAFAQMSFAGIATFGAANVSGLGVRPYFLLCGGVS